MQEIGHLLGLHMHQPPGNLKLLIEADPWEARQIMLCYERPLRYAARYRDVASFAVGFSGILLEQLQDPEIVSRYQEIVNIPEMLEAYRKAENIELIGMGYYHPIFPLIPREDWDAQLQKGKGKVLEVFGREPKGFWPPEMAFTMEMIPALKRHGYEFVIVDGVHVKPLGDLSREEVLYQPHLAEFEGETITVIPRDRDLSNAQQSGLDPTWFNNEVRAKTALAPRPCLVTTWSDGENGGWFRQTHEEAGFWGHYFAPYMERVRRGEMSIRPVPIREFLALNPPRTRVTVQTGAWNIGTRGGYDFSQWSGSEGQRQALKALWEVSRALHEAEAQAKLKVQGEALKLLEEANRCLLRAETSCFLFWGEAWLSKLYDELQPAKDLIANAVKRMEEAS